MWRFRLALVLALTAILFGCPEREVEVSAESPDISAPDTPSDFKSFAHPDRIELFWDNPEDDDFTGMLLVRSEGGDVDLPAWGEAYEAGDELGDGVVAYVGDDEEFVDYDISCGKGYKYYLFAFDDSHNYSAPAKLEALPGGMAVPRIAFAATTLADGRVLITGGISYGGPTDTAEIFDPATGEFRLIADRMSSSRFYHTATLLADGRVLIAGGFKEGLSETLATAEIFDPATERFVRLSAELNRARAGHKSYLLPDGDVLLVGGTDGITPLASAEVWNAETEEFSELDDEMAYARVGFTMTPFERDGAQYLLVAGGVGTDGFALDTAEIFDTEQMRFENLAGEAGGVERMACAHAAHGAVALDASRILIVGGYEGDDVSGEPVACTEIFDPSSDEPFVRTGDLVQPRSGFAISTLADGRIAVFGGTGAWLEILGSAEVFDPESETWTSAGTMIVARTVPAAIPLDDGVLLVGGNASGNLFEPKPLATPELFDPKGLNFSLFVSCSR